MPVQKRWFALFRLKHLGIKTYLNDPDKNMEVMITHDSRFGNPDTRKRRLVANIFQKKNKVMVSRIVSDHKERHGLRKYKKGLRYPLKTFGHKNGADLNLIDKTAKGKPFIRGYFTVIDEVKQPESELLFEFVNNNPSNRKKVRKFLKK